MGIQIIKLSAMVDIDLKQGMLNLLFHKSPMIWGYYRQ
jgi:hypothetical protein